MALEEEREGCAILPFVNLLALDVDPTAPTPMVETHAMVGFMPSRKVIQGDGIAWLRAAQLGPEHAIVTSIPDVSEMQPSDLGASPGLDLQQWRDLAVEIATLACTRVDPRSLVVFYQTDIKVEGRTIDKGYLVHHGAEQAGAHCLWHKIVCRTAPGNTTFGRPAYGHWLAFSRELRAPVEASTPDVEPDLGPMTWARATPLPATVATCRFLREHTQCRVVVDPFCGHGTVLAVANAHGLDALGVELSAKRARKARRMTMRDGVIDHGNVRPASSGDETSELEEESDPPEV